MGNIESDSNQRQPLVSVGIPTFNRPQGLSRVLQCIQKQTYKNIEVIVSDNCTPGEEVNQLMHSIVSNDNRFQYFRQPNNTGATANFEFVLYKSTGKYFFWAADDDLCEETFIERIVAVLEANPDVALCTCDIKNIDENDSFLEISKLDEIRISSDWKISRPLFFRYPTSNIFFCVYGIFKTEELKQCGILSSAGWKGIAINTEVVFLAKFSQWGKIVAIPENLKSYRRHQDSEYHSATRTISWFDTLMLQLSIRVRLCKVALTSEGSWKTRLSLVAAIIKSFLENLRPPAFILRLIPGRVRSWLKRVLLRTKVP